MNEQEHKPNSHSLETLSALPDSPEKKEMSLEKVMSHGEAAVQKISDSSREAFSASEKKIKELQSLDPVIAGELAPAVEAIQQRITKESSDASEKVRNLVNEANAFSKTYHHPDYRSEVARNLVEARKNGGDAEGVLGVFNAKTIDEKASFESQDKERSVAEVMKEKDVVFLHGVPMSSMENRGSDFNNRVVNNNKLTFEDTYDLVNGLNPTISVFAPSVDRPNNGMFKSQGFILGEGKILTAKAQDSFSEAFGLQKRIPKAYNEDHKHSAIQPTLDVEKIIPGEGLRGRDVLYNEITVEKPQVAGLYYDMSFDEGEYDPNSPGFQGYGDEKERQEVAKTMKEKALRGQQQELGKMREYSEKIGVPLYVFKNENQELKKYRVDFEEHPEWTREYLEGDIVPRIKQKLDELGGNPNNSEFLNFKSTIYAPIYDYVIKGERSYKLTPVTAEEITKGEKVLSSEEKLKMVERVKEKGVFLGQSEKEVSKKLLDLQKELE